MNSSVIGILINNYLVEAGRGGKYTMHIEVVTSTAELFLSLLKSYPTFPTSDLSSKFWIPLEAKLIKLRRKQENIYSAEELSNGSSMLEFPDILDGRSSSQNLVKGQPLPNMSATSLERFGSVIDKFTLRSWTVDMGGITAILQEVILIDKYMRPNNLQQSLDIATLSSPSKRRKVIP